MNPPEYKMFKAKLNFSRNGLEVSSKIENSQYFILSLLLVSAVIIGILIPYLRLFIINEGHDEQIMKFSAFLSVSVIISFHIIDIFNQESKISLLETLEQKIVLGEIDNNEIRKEFISSIVGKKINDWIVEQEKSITDKSIFINNELDLLKTKLAEFQSIDTSLSYEKKGRFKEIKEKYANINGDIIKFNADNLMKLKQLNHHLPPDEVYLAKILFETHKANTEEILCKVDSFGKILDEIGLSLN